ncbi:transketolase [Aerococcaceae bacterium zg-BR9]|uniref:transketolase n=1 Tax=Aerococcaceae bacterium zg-1292 TaxID=2774330 RepID=UPI0040638279|nr:transketolase [Aerococcaceae bacterium zg-BR9]
MDEQRLVNLEIQATKIRKRLWEMIYQSKTGHTGGDLSSADILTTLYYEVMNINPENPKDPNRDRYVQSKGHAAEVYWTTLALRGFFDEEILDTYYQFQSPLIGHPTNKMPGVEMNTGSLGHGLSISVGMALAAKIDSLDYKVFTLLGDGELAEGSNWEAAMAASHYKLNNLIAIIDCNKLQITGNTSDVMNNSPLKEKWESFGWKVVEIDGHNYEQLIIELSQNESIDKPKMIIANTIKGKGISIAEGKAGWHHHVPNDEEYRLGLEELNAKLEVLVNE